jgi:HSP20 family protein
MPANTLLTSLLGDFDQAVNGRRLDAMAPVDAYRRDDVVVIHLDLPGVELDSVHVEVEGSWLTVGAERRYAPDPGDRVLVSQRPFGSFTRRLRLPDDLEVGEAAAELRDGVLTVRIPVRAGARRRLTPVAAGADDRRAVTVGSTV